MWRKLYSSLLLHAIAAYLCIYLSKMAGKLNKKITLFVIVYSGHDRDPL